MNEFNDLIRNQLKELFKESENILAVWEGGSAATGYLDELSDLDLGVIVSDDTVEACFTSVETLLDETYGIKHKFRMPEPNWHGHSQCFYILHNTPESFYVDLLIEKESSGNRFLEEDRHGKAQVWLDRKNLIDQTPTSAEEILAKSKNQYNMIKTYLPFTFIDLKKQIKRGNYIDAVAIYFGLLNRFNTLLNMEYRPAKFDFGLRYLYRDFPENVVLDVEKLCRVSSLEELSSNLEYIEKQFQNLINKLDERYI